VTLIKVSARPPPAVAAAAAAMVRYMYHTQSTSADQTIHTTSLRQQFCLLCAKTGWPMLLLQLQVNMLKSNKGTVATAVLLFVCKDKLANAVSATAGQHAVSRSSLKVLTEQAV